jgi:hypothetical protein
MQLHGKFGALPSPLSLSPSLAQVLTHDAMQALFTSQMEARVISG